MEKKQNTLNPDKNMELPSKAVSNFFEQAQILKVWLANNELAANTRIGRFNWPVGSLKLTFNPEVKTKRKKGEPHIGLFFCIRAHTLFEYRIERQDDETERVCIVHWIYDPLTRKLRIHKVRHAA
jgi:hypothetical protein